MGKAISVSGDQWKELKSGMGIGRLTLAFMHMKTGFVIDSHYDELGGFDYKVYLVLGENLGDVAEDDRPQWDDDWHFDNADDSMFKAIEVRRIYSLNYLKLQTGESSKT